MTDTEQATAALVLTHTTTVGSLDLPGPVQIVAGVGAGFGIGVVATLMATGSIAGALLGGLLLGVIPDLLLIPGLAIILLLSALKVARHT